MYDVIWRGQAQLEGEPLFRPLTTDDSIEVPGALRDYWMHRTEGLEEAIDFAAALLSRADIEEESVEIAGEFVRFGEGAVDREATCYVDLGAMCQRPAGTISPSRTWNHCQRYLAAASFWGVDAAAGWSRFETKDQAGAGVVVVDLEQGWRDHEDIPSPDAWFWPQRPGEYTEHGLMVLGVLNASASDPGVTGIVPGAHMAVAQVGLKKATTPFNVLRSVIQRASKGTIILIEDQRSGIRMRHGQLMRGEKLPLEAFRCGRRLAKWAITLGHYVVEAGGNGNNQLDLWLTAPPYDSGAIVVGAACPGTSNRILGVHGTRVDLSAWGAQVVTCADRSNGDLQLGPTDESCYTLSFDGTSAAAAIVAGCVALMASIAVKQNKVIPPLDLRDCLVHTGHMTAPGIGPRPNIRAALANLGL